MLQHLFGRPTPAQTLDITIHNTLGNTTETVVPLKKGVVTMYTCGPTVYDFAHIGNLRSYIMADILKRALTYAGYTVKHTINFTDFGHLTDDADAGEDKMMKGLKREGLPITLESMRDLSDRYIEAFKADCEELRIVPPTTWARASDYLTAQIRLVETLEDKGFAYATPDGVYFSIEKFPAYGALGNIDLTALKSGARVEVNEHKHHPADFAIWKNGELGWPSRFGTGFPGWHIECSAMAIATLGKQIDIHTGGIDHIHTHHNAEIAQSEAATGKSFARYWIHNAFITIDNTKVAKSLGNSITLRHLLDRGFSGDDYRYWLLTAHYSSTVNFTFDALTAAKHALFRLKRHMYEDYKRVSGRPSAEYLKRFDAAIADNLDTPKAIAILWDIVKDTTLNTKTKCGTILAIDNVLDIGLSDDVDTGVRSLGVISKVSLPDEIQDLIDGREAARIARNWAEADRQREALTLKGYTVEDTPTGPKVSKLL